MHLLSVALPILSLGVALGQESFCDNGLPGVSKRMYCCKAECVTCGGEGCETRAEGLTGEDCCISDIERVGNMCMDTGAAPCMGDAAPDATAAQTAAETEEETEEETPEEETEFTCDGENGIPNKDICCAASCGMCGGKGCPEFPGGEYACCTGDIRTTGEYCSETGAAPCIIGEAAEATAAPTAEETEEETPVPEGDFYCEGEMGIRNKGVCCAASCGVCGGEGCTELPGGEYLCCTQDIQEAGLVCSETGAAPCIIEDVVVLIPGDTAAPTAAPTAEETEEETEEETPVPEGDFKCEGEMGIRNKGVCCAASCEFCGGEGCTDDLCCTTDIEDAGLWCSETGAAPCLIDDVIGFIPGDTFAPTATPTPEGEFVCEGDMGILNDNVCCAASCGMCGGDGCTEFIGGEDLCCTTDIIDAGQLCSETGAAPCLTEIVVLESTYREIGCFADKPYPDRVKTNSVTSSYMTVEMCQEHCADSIYFGLEYGIECWCDDGMGDANFPFDIHGPSDGCDKPCAGDESQICGGFYAMNVYENV